MKKSLEKRFWSKVRKTRGCWIWIGTMDSKGYGRIGWDLQRRPIRIRKTTGAHRFSYELRYGKIDPALACCHRCDNPRCVRPDHLFIGTTAENHADMVKKGRNAKGMRVSNPGERNAAAKLFEKSVKEIRRRYSRGCISQMALAVEYGVNQQSISNVVRRQTWK